MKNKLMIGLSALAPVAAFAEGEATSTVDVSKITTSVQTVGAAAQQGLEAAVDAAIPYIVGALVATIVIYSIPLMWRWIKRVFGR